MGASPGIHWRVGAASRINDDVRRRAEDELTLLRRAERALDSGDEGAVDLLVRLARSADSGGDAWVFAHRQLAEIAAPNDPWRAAILARRVVRARPDDAHGWALLGLACSLLGHTRAATAAYEDALARQPDNPYYAHNLGHLYDVGLNRFDDALRWLARAVALAPDDPEIAASYAHALARAGRVPEARRIMRHVARGGLAPHHEPLRKWIEGGAAPDTALKPARGTTRRRS
jgi:Flp pilus assembly protein TadD